MPANVTIEPANVTDLPSILALLDQNDLPEDDLIDHLETSLVARVDGNVIGNIALEVYGDAALLRSAVVDQVMRWQGVGHRLIETVLALAQQNGVTHVYLLTETASEFFPRFGFRAVNRSEIPAAVKQSVEFTSICPDSALAMMVKLA